MVSRPSPGEASALSPRCSFVPLSRVVANSKKTVAAVADVVASLAQGVRGAKQAADRVAHLHDEVADAETLIEEYEREGAT